MQPHKKLLTIDKIKGDLPKIEDLKNVSGIGDKKYEALKGYSNSRVDSRMRTTRPSIPPLLFGGIVFWVVVAALYIPLMSLDASTLAVVCWLSVALVAVMLIVFWRNKKSYILLVSLFAVAGVVVVGTGAGEYLTRARKSAIRILS